MKEWWKQRKEKTSVCMWINLRLERGRGGRKWGVSERYTTAKDRIYDSVNKCHHAFMELWGKKGRQRRRDRGRERNIISNDAFVLVDKQNFKWHHGKTWQLSFHITLGNLFWLPDICSSWGNQNRKLQGDVSSRGSGYSREQSLDIFITS